MALAGSSCHNRNSNIVLSEWKCTSYGTTALNFMMSDPHTEADPAQTTARPFPWFCPKCRRKEVRRDVIPYQCDRFCNGQPMKVVLTALVVPKCGHCGELVFDYEADEQLNRAFQ